LAERPRTCGSPNLGVIRLRGSYGSIPRYQSGGELSVHERPSPRAPRTGHWWRDRASLAPPHHPVFGFPTAPPQRLCAGARVFHDLRGDRHLGARSLRRRGERRLHGRLGCRRGGRGSAHRPLLRHAAAGLVDARVLTGMDGQAQPHDHGRDLFRARNVLPRQRPSGSVRACDRKRQVRAPLRHPYEQGERACKTRAGTGDGARRKPKG
jgi:hypothetical protein